MNQLQHLTQLADRVLVEELPTALKDAIDAAIANGRGRKSILALIRKTAGKRSLVTLAAEAYLEQKKPR